ncbi:PhlD [Streptomyces sp. SCA3-4]|uniref:PhlD n=1 Tax=Streptomyces sichuanensis TaxID=2871810 RepID=UPI001CE3B5A9|nr:PhlD [Streptomyces sichuanensis]MCA6091116.1 PhlD [Streptomyces sichuanensis]
MGVVSRLLNAVQVETRYFTRPLTDPLFSAPAGIAERNRAAFDECLGLAADAARQALAHARLSPEDIDAVVTSHTSSWQCPGLAVRLIGELGLRSDVRRVEMGSLACVGGAQGLAKAADHVRAHPGSRALVVVAEKLSTSYHRSETTKQSIIYKGLFGDGAAATVVSAEPLGPGLRLHATLEYLLPDSRNAYWGAIDEAGFHFDSTDAATRAVTRVMPRVLEWLRTEDVRPDFAVVHPGGPGILHQAADALGMTDSDLAPSWECLRHIGNIGGPAVLDVLARVYDRPPASGATGLVLGFGPGFTTTALHATWHENRPSFIPPHTRGSDTETASGARPAGAGG